WPISLGSRLLSRSSSQRFSKTFRPADEKLSSSPTAKAERSQRPQWDISTQLVAARYRTSACCVTDAQTTGWLVRLYLPQLGSRACAMIPVPVSETASTPWQTSWALTH